MTTTCNDIVTRAVGLSVANQGLLDPAAAADVALALSQINQAQHRAFTLFTKQNKTGEMQTVVLSSTTGAGNRALSMASVVPAVQRVIRITIPDGTELALVDPNAPQAELAPRYFTYGETIAEIGNDWDTSSAGAVQLTILYSVRPVAIDPAGALTQAVSLPDRHADILVFEMGAWLAERDVGREDAEVADLLTKRDAALTSWVESAAQFGGVSVYSFDIPTPSADNKD